MLFTRTVNAGRIHSASLLRTARSCRGKLHFQQRMHTLSISGPYFCIFSRKTTSDAAMHSVALNCLVITTTLRTHSLARGAKRYAKFVSLSVSLKSQRFYLFILNWAVRQPISLQASLGKRTKENLMLSCIGKKLLVTVIIYNCSETSRSPKGPKNSFVQDNCFVVLSL